MEAFKVIDILGALPGPWSETGFHRILTASGIIKYLALPSPDGMLLSFGESFDFTTIPQGEWNMGHLAFKPGTQQVTLNSTELVALASIKNTWNPQMVDFLDLKNPTGGARGSEMQGFHQMYSAVYEGHFDVDKVIACWEWHPHDIYGPTHETDIYALIQEHDIAPRFLAHVTENRSRVIGFMVERLPGRHAVYDDLQACQEALSKLHGIGIAQGCLRRSSFLVTDNRAFLHSFGGSYRTEDKTILDAEMASLEGILQGDCLHCSFGKSISER